MNFLNKKYIITQEPQERLYNSRLCNKLSSSKNNSFNNPNTYLIS